MCGGRYFGGSGPQFSVYRVCCGFATLKNLTLNKKQKLGIESRPDACYTEQNRKSGAARSGMRAEALRGRPAAAGCSAPLPLCVRGR